MKATSTRVSRRFRHLRRVSRPRTFLRVVLAGSIFSVIGASLAFGAADTYTWDPAGDLSGSGGTGAWNLSTSNWLNAGADVMWPNNASTALFNAGTGTVTLGSPITAGMLNFTGGAGAYTIAGTAANPLTLTTAGGAASGLSFPAISVTSTSAQIVSAVLAGTEGFHKQGIGTLRLTGANTITGGLTIEGGILQLGAGGSLNGNIVTLQTGGELQLAGVNATVGGLTGTAGTVDNVSGTAAVLTITGANTSVFGGLVQNGTGAGVLSLALNGGATQTLSANNTFTGNLAIDGASTLVYTGGSQTVNSQLGLAATGGTNYKTVTLTNGGTFRVSTADYNDNVITSTNLGAGQVFIIGTGGGALSVDAGRLFTIDDGSGAGTGTGNAQLQGAGLLTKTGLGTLSLGNGTASDYSASFTGGIVVAQGILKLGGTKAVTGASGINVSSGATFDIGGQNGVAQKTVTIAGTGASGAAGAFANSSTTDVTNGVQSLVLSANATVGGAGRLDIRANGGTPTLNMGGFQLTTAMTGGKYFALVGTTVSNPGTILVSTGGLDIEGGTNLAGSATNTLTVNNGAFLNYFSFTGSDTWTHIMQGGSKLQTNSSTAATTDTVAGPFTLNGAVTVALNANDNLVLNGIVSGAGAFNITSGGTLTLSNPANSYAGVTTISAGTLTASGSGAVPGPLTITGGTVNHNAAGAIAGNITQSNGTFAQTGILNGATQSYTLSGGTANFNQANTLGGGIAVNGGVLNATVANAAPGNVTIGGTGVLNASAANSLPGTVTVTGGTLNSTASTAANANPIALNGGNLTSGATGTFGAVVSGSGPNTIAPGGLGSLGTLTLGSLTAGAGTVFSIDPGLISGAAVTTGDNLTINGAFTIASGASVGGNIPTANGQYRVLAYNNTAGTPDFGNLALPSNPRVTYTYSSDGTVEPSNGSTSYLDLVVSQNGPNATSTYSGTGGGSYNSTTNWDTNIIPGVAGDTAIFSGSIGNTNSTVTLDAQQHVGMLMFTNSTGTGTYTLSAGTGGSLVLENGAAVATVTNSNNSNTISAPMALSSSTNFTVAGGSTLTLSGQVSGPGLLLASGGGTLALTGTNNLYAGSTSIVGGSTLSINSDASLGPVSAANTVTVDGGSTLTFNYLNATNTGRIYNIGSGGGTLNPNFGAGTAGKIFLSTAGQLTGSGTLTKAGQGMFQISGNNSTFTGDVNINAGVIEAQNQAAIGTVGKITINGTGATPATQGELVITGGTTLLNDVTLNGTGIISADGTGAGVLAGRLTVPNTGSFNLFPRAFFTTTTASSLTISGPITGGANPNFSTTQTTAGIVTLTGDNTNWTSLTGSDSTTPFPAVTSTLSLGFGAKSRPGAATGIYIPLSGGTFSILSDGDGYGTPNSGGTFTDTFNLTASSTLAVGHAGTGIPAGSPLFVTAVNKTITEANALAIGAGLTLTVTNNNGYGLNLAGPVTLTGTPTLAVTTATASNLVPGLTVSGAISGTGFNKTGAGTIALTSTQSDFTGNVNVNAGLLALDANANDTLGNGANEVVLNAGGLRFTDDLASFTRAIKFGSSGGSIEVAPNKTATLDNAFDSAGTLGAALAKNDDGVLVLNAGNTSTTYTGALTVNAGAVRLTNPSALGGGSLVVPGVVGAAVQLGGGYSFATPINLNSTANLALGGINNGGQLENFSGTNTTTGVISMSFDAGIGADAGTTLNINGGINNPTTSARALIFNGFGTINVNSSATAPSASNQYYSINKYGLSTLNFTTANPIALTSNFTIYSGAVNLTGLGSIASGTVGATLYDGASLTLDNAATNVPNRFGTGRAIALNSASFNYVANGTTANTETFGALTEAWGTDAVNITAGAGATLNFASLGAPAGGATVSFTLTGTGALFGSSTTKVMATAAPALTPATVGIIPRMVVIDSNGTSLATYSTGLASAGNGLVALATYNVPTISSVTTNASATVTVADASVLSAGQAVYGPNIPANTTISSISGNTLTLSANATAAGTVLLTYGAAPYTSINSLAAQRATGDNIRIGTGYLTGSDATIAQAARTFNSVTIGDGASLATGAGYSALTITSGSLLSNGAAASTNTIGNGVLLAAGGTELSLLSAAGTTLSVNGTISGTANLTKGLEGDVVFNSPQFFSTGGGVFTINGAGTVKLNAGSNTLFPGTTSYLAVAPQATLDLNGNNQLVGSVTSPGNSTTAAGYLGSGGTITSATPAALLDASGQAQIFGGKIAGNIYFGKSGNNALSLYNENTFTGGLRLMGNTTSLIDYGQLSGLTAATPIELNGGSLALNNNGAANLFDRIPDAVPINLRAGSIAFTGRAATAAAETLGALNLVQGSSEVALTAVNTGVNSIDLTFASINQTSPDATLNIHGYGLIGSNARILVTTPPAVVNNIVTPAIESGATDWATYIPGLGLTSLNQTGAPGYDGTILPVNNLFPSVPTAQQNIKLGTAGVIPSGGFALNTLNLNGVGVTFAAPGDTLNLTAGGLIHQGATSAIGGSVSSGRLTAGGASPTGTVPFYVYNGANTLTINSRIVDNGSAPIRLIVSHFNGGVVSLTDANSYSGGTVVNGWVGGNGGSLSLNGAAGTVVLPAGDITLTNGSLVEVTNGGQINSANSVQLNGSSVLTLVGANTLNKLTFDNNGGVANPTVNTGGVLTLSDSTPITVTSGNPSTLPAIGGTLDFSGTARTLSIDSIKLNGATVAPLTSSLNISGVIQNAGQITKTGAGNLQLSGGSTFTGGIFLSQGGLTIGANSAQTVVGAQVFSGPLGSGTLTVASGANLLASTASTVLNQVVLQGDVNFLGLTALTLNGGVSLPAGGSTVNVAAPQMTATLGGAVSGTGALTKTGYGTLTLNNVAAGVSSFSGGIALNAGILQAVATGTSGTALGTGTVNLNGGLLQLRASGVGSNGTVIYGNDILINSTLSAATIDINNNGANTGNTLQLGNLGYTGFNGTGAAPGTVLYVTGGNNYRLQFTGTTLTGANSSPTFNVGSGLTLVLPGGFTAGTNLPTNVGLGTLAYSGSNNGVVATSPIVGTVQVVPATGQSSTPLGTGAITLNGGSTLQIVPTFGTLSTAGYTTGGLTAKYYSTAATTTAAAANFGLAPSSTLVGVQPNDATFRLPSPGVTPVNAVSTLAVYQGLLTVATGGTYYFGGASDDQLQIMVDGQSVLTDIGGGHGLQNAALGSITLAPGAHQITVRGFNNGSGGGNKVVYSGPDTAGNGATGSLPIGNLQALPVTALSYATDYTAANGYQNAALLNNALTVAASGSATIDGLGTDFNYGIPSLTLGNGATLVAANGTGTAVGSIGNGAFVVTGLTTLGTGGTLSPTTGTLVLAGGVSDSGNGFSKTGQGNLELGASTAFTGALNISGGFVQLLSGTSLTTGTTTVGSTTVPATLDLNGQTVTTTGDIVLNGGAGPAAKSSATGAGLYNSSAVTASLPADGTLSIGAATASVNASVGGFGDIVLNGVVRNSVAGSAWNKVGPDTLTLNGANLFTGAFNITAGEVVLGNASALGGTGATVLTSGAALDLNGQNTGTELLTLAGAGRTAVGAPNTLGALINSSSTSAIVGGAVTLSAATSIGSPVLAGTPTGSIAFNGNVTGAQVITKAGTNNLTFTSGSNAITDVDVANGSVTLSGAGKLGATASSFVRQNATLTLDNSGTAVSSRLGNQGMWFSGNLVLTGNASTAVTEITTNGANNIAVGGGSTNNTNSSTTNTFANGYGGSTITINADGTAGVTFGVNSTSTSIFNRGQGSSLLLRGDNLGGTPGANTATVLGNATSLGYSTNGGQATGQAGTFANANTLIYPWAVVDNSATGVGTSFATYKDNTAGIVSLQSSGGFVTTAPALVTVQGNTTSGNGSVLVASTAGLAVGMVVQGAGVTTGTVINSISGNTLTLSANSTGSGNNTLVFSSANTGNAAYPNLVSTAATNTVGLTNVAQELNSLTLNNAAGSALTINTGLQLDSGGILAVGTDAGHATYTIGGTGTLTGTNTFNRELIIHTTGAGTTLNISAPIFGNVFPGSSATTASNVGLTKADGGTLILSSQETYTGDTVINGGTLQLAGGANTLFPIYTLSPTSGNAGATDTYQNLTVNTGGTLDLNGNNQVVGNLRSGSAVQLNGGTIVNSTGTATLHVQLNANQTWAGSLSNTGAGTLNFVRDGNNTLTVNSPNTLGGTVTLTGGATTLIDLGTFENASAINVTRAALIWNDTGVQAVSIRLSSTAPITLTGGGLQFVGRAGTGSTPVDAISLGTLNLGIGANSVNMAAPQQGGASKVTFAGLGTRAPGATLAFIGASLGDNPNIYFTSAPTLTNGIIGAWATVSGTNSIAAASEGSFATYDPAAGIRAVEYQTTALYGAGVNTLISASATLPGAVGVPGTTTVNSLTLWNASTLSFPNATETLLVQSGGIISGNDANNRALGASTTVPGQIKAGAGKDFYIHGGANTLTINAKIVDNGGTNVFFDSNSSAASTFTLTNGNTYGGSTYLSGGALNLNSSSGPAIPGNLIFSGSNNAAADSLAYNSTTVNWQQPNQLTATANVTMNGATQLNLGASVPSTSTVSNSQTINNLTINNDGGTNSLGGPTIYTGAGTLTIGGTLAATSAGVTSTIPTLNGFYKFTTGNISVAANQYVPNQLGLALNGNITADSLTKTGNGWLGIGGQSPNFTGPVNVNEGGLAFSSTTGTSGVIIGGQVALNAPGVIFDTRGISGVVGSVASDQETAVLMNGLQSAAGTLTTGLDNQDATYAGIITSPFLSGLLNVNKIGTGTWTLTNTSMANNNGTLTVSQGNVALTGITGAISFTTTTLLPGGTLLVDNLGSQRNDRLGGATLLTTAAILSPTYRTINMQGGNLTIGGDNGQVAVSEALGNLGNIQGGGIITLNAAGSAGVNVTLGQISGQGAATSLLIRGDNLGAAVGTDNTGGGTATLRFATSGAVNTFPGLGSLVGGSGANNTLTRSIRPDILVSSSATGLGDGFLVVDSVTGLIRPLNAGTEQQTTPTLALGYVLPTTTVTGTDAKIVTVPSTAGLVVGQGVTGTGIPGSATIASITDATHFVLSAAATAAGTVNGTYGLLGTNNQNVKTSAVTPLLTNTTVNSITLGDGGGFTTALQAGNPWASTGGLLTLTNTSTGLLNTAGSNTISTGAYGYGGVTADFHVLAGSTLTMNAVVSGGAGGMTKADGGTLVLNQPFFGNNATTIAINGGTLQLGATAGTNALWVYSGVSGYVPSAENLAVNNGTFDLGGNNQLVGALTSSNPLPYGGGTAASPNIFVTNSSATTATFSTNAANSVFSGEITGNLNLDKSGNTTMSLSSPQTYTGTTTIRGGSLTLRDSGSIASTAPITANFAELTLDNTGLSSSTTRIGSTVPLNFTGGTLRMNNSEHVDSENFGPLTLNGGANIVYAAEYSNNGNGSSPTFTFANLAQSNNATLLFEAPYNGSVGNFAGANAHVYLTQLNGTAFSTASLTNNIIAPWFLIASTNNIFGWASYSNTAGLTLLNANGAPNYASAFGGGVNSNLNITATVQSVAGQTVNTLAVINPSAAVTVGLNGPADQLVLGAGGLLLNDSQSKGLFLQGGSLTAGTLNNASTLYLHAYAGSDTINTPIMDNGTGTLTLVRDGNAALTLNPLQVESLTTAQLPINSTTITVPNAAGLAVGMAVSGTGIASGSLIKAISGNTITLSAATSGTANTVTAQISFAPAVSTATSTTTAGSNTVTLGTVPTGFTPVVGQTIGGPNLPGGTTITAINGNTLTLSQNALASGTTAALTLGALSNTYSGPTVIGSTTDQYAGGTTTLGGQAGAIVIPGDLTINGGATVTMATNQGQIASTSNLTINGSGVLNLTGTNTLNSVTFNNSGGNGTPTVAAATLLNLTSATPITAVNDNTGTNPTINGTALNLASPTGATIDVSGASLNDFVLAPTTLTSAGTITKTGSGSLILPNAQAAALTWSLTGGSLFVSNATSLGTSTAGGALSFNGNVGLAATGGGMNVALPTIFAGPTTLTLGGQHGNNNITLTGAMDLNGQAPTISSATAVSSNTITGKITGSGGFTKGGPGILTLTPGTASDFSGPVTVAAGELVAGNANAFPAAKLIPLSISTGAAFHVNGQTVTLGGLSGAGAVIGSGTLLLGGTSATEVVSNVSGGIFSGVIAGSVILNKDGLGSQTLSGSNLFTGAVTVNAGSLVITNSGALGIGVKTVTVAAATNPTSNPSLRLDGSAGALTLPSNLSFATSYDANSGANIAAGQGALVNVAGDNVIQGNLSLVGGGGGSVYNVLGGSLTLNGGISSGYPTGSRTLLLAGPGDGFINGAITNGQSSVLVQKAQGTGTWVLAGNDTYTGTTVVSPNAGTLQFAKEVSLPATRTAALISVGSGSTLAFNVGGTGEFTESDITTLAGLGNGTGGGFQSGSSIGLDTTNAAGGSFTYSGAIANPNNNSLGLTKLGSGTLVLSATGTQTYTGKTDVQKGTLEIHGAISGFLNINSAAVLDATSLAAGLVLASGQTVTTSGNGTGTIAGSLTSAGSVSPGGAGAIGTLAVTGGTTLNDGSMLNLDLATNANDLLSTPSLTISGTASLTLAVAAPVPLDGHIFVIANTSTVASGFFQGSSPNGFGGAFDAFTLTPGETLNTFTASNGELFAISYTGDATHFESATGTQVVLMAVPEPSATGSLLAGLAALAGLQRFRRRRA